MSNSEDTNNAAVTVHQEVGSVSGGKVTAIEVASQVAQQITNQTVVDQRTITNNIIALNDPHALDVLVAKLVEVLGVNQSVLQEKALPSPEPHIGAGIDAVAAAQQAVAAQGLAPSGRALYDLGMLMTYRRNLDAALDYFHQAERAEPGLAEAHESIAWLQQSRAAMDLAAGDAASAWSRLNEARAAVAHADPDDARVLALSGYIARDAAVAADQLHQASDAQRLRAEAVGTFEQAARRFPDDPSVLNGLAGSYAEFGDYDAAIGSYKRVIQLAPGYAVAYHDLALAYEGKQRADRSHAAKWCEQALDTWKEFQRIWAEDPAGNPGLSDEYMAQIGGHVQALERECALLRPSRKKPAH